MACSSFRGIMDRFDLMLHMFLIWGMQLKQLPKFNHM